MGLSRSAILVKDASEHEMLEIGGRLGVLAADPVKVRDVEDQADIGYDEFGVACLNGWGVLYSDPSPYFEAEPTLRLSELSASREVFFWLTQSAVAGLWFEYHADGALLRKWVEVESQVHVCEGEPLSQEPIGFFTADPDHEGERDEWKLLEICEATTGVSTELLFGSPFAVYASGL